MSSMPGSDKNSVVAVFSQHSAAENAIRELKGGGFDIKKLAVVGRDYQSGIAGRDGAVLPILHLNGYKINNPTMLARISHEEPETCFGAMAGHHTLDCNDDSFRRGPGVRLWFSTGYAGLCQPRDSKCGGRMADDPHSNCAESTGLRPNLRPQTDPVIDCCHAFQQKKEQEQARQV